MSRHARFTKSGAFMLLLVFTGSAMAQKAPELGYVFPPVVKPGSTTTVQLGGYDLTPDLQYFVHHPDIKLQPLGPPGKFLVPGPPYWFGQKARGTAFPIPREFPARITVPADMPNGPVRWQVANANGSSAPALFYVSNGNEEIENRLRDEPLWLKSLPIAVSGRIKKIAEVDRYQFKATKNGPITLDLLARRLRSDFQGMLEIVDDQGKVIASAADTEGCDLTLTFAAQKGKTYEARLHDIDFRGNRAFVYRLAVHPRPGLVATIPAYGQRGKKTPVTFIGYGIRSGSPRLEAISREITFPRDHSPVFRYSLKTDFGTAPISIPLSDLNEQTEPKERSRNLPKISVPGAITGCLSQKGEEDRYVVQASKGQEYRLTLQSRAIGAKLDVELQILNPMGKSMALIDDSNGTMDAEAFFKAPADGDYTCIVRDTSGQDGNPAALYRLAIVPQQPDFVLTAPQQINLPLGGKAQVPIKVQRRGGFTDAIALTMEGLPNGVSSDRMLTIPKGKNVLKVPLAHAKEAAATAAFIRIRGVGAQGDRKIVRFVTAPAAGSRCPRVPGENETSHLMLSTTMKPPFSVELVDRNRQRAVHRGTTYPAEFLIKRENGFQGELLLQMASRQGRHRQGIYGPVVQVAPDQEKALYPCFMPEWLETDRTTRMVVLGVARVRDPKGNLRYLTKPADARITMILEGALLKLSHRAREPRVQPGQRFEIPLEISRSSKLGETVKVELAGPDPIRDLLEAKSLTMAPDQSKAVLIVQTKPDKRLQGDWRLTIKATALEKNRWPVVAQTEVTVRFNNR